ncbi:hypothetical protein [Psychrobacter sp. DM4]|uniref:hypothetical protein n=1 Tax=Psychrobacter sp. DM4 TaxID=3440637 RepID=UPI003F5098D6
MATLSAFQKYLSNKSLLPQSSRQYVHGQEQQLREWTLHLSSQTQNEQAHQLEEVFADLAASDLDDDERLTLASIVMSATDKLIVDLRKHYIYEMEAFKAHQMRYVSQVESLYYAAILVYDGVIQRHLERDSQALIRPKSGWIRYFTHAKAPIVSPLSIAIYHSLALYQRLLAQKAICYQYLPANIWLGINQLYYTAEQYNLTHVDLSAEVVTRHADTIHKLYVQICLHSLLNVRSLSRADILLLQRLLPEWSNHVVAGTNPETKTRVFVDLHSDYPPTYLTGHSRINPYKKEHDCVFIELAPLATYLQSRRPFLATDGSEMAIQFLMDKVWSMLSYRSYRYIQQKYASISTSSSKQRATIITGFNTIHYNAAGKKSLMSLIALQKIPLEWRPRYDTQPTESSNKRSIPVETFSSVDSESPFRTLHLLPNLADFSNQQTDNAWLNKEDATDLKGDTGFSNAIYDSVSSTAPPVLKLMNLFLLCRTDKNGDNTDRSIGVVRWVNIDQQNRQGGSLSGTNQEIEWQILGHKFSACALRLIDRGARNQHLIPALIIGSDTGLQTNFSLLLPTHNWKVNDRVMVCINDKQQSLRLQRKLLTTEEFSQFEAVYI